MAAFRISSFNILGSSHTRKGGKGALSLNGTPLDVKQAKQLPSSD